MKTLMIFLLLLPSTLSAQWMTAITEHGDTIHVLKVTEQEQTYYYGVEDSVRTHDRITTETRQPRLLFWELKKRIKIKVKCYG